MPLLQHSLHLDAAVGADPQLVAVVPSWQFADGDSAPTRKLGPAVVVPLDLDATGYTAAIPDEVFVGTDPGSARRGLLAAMQDGALESITSRIGIQCRTRAGLLAGLIEVPVVVLATPRAVADVEASGDRVAVEKAGDATPVELDLFFVDAAALTKKLTGMEKDEASVHLRVLALSTALDDGRPRLRAISAAAAKRLGEHGPAALEWVQKAWRDLTDITVRITAPTALRVAGTLAVTGGSSDPTAADFAPLRVVAEWADADGSPRAVTATFDASAEVKKDAVAFDLTTGRAPVFLASIADSVRVSVRGLTGATLATTTYVRDDDALSKLALAVPRQQAGTLEAPPKPVADRNLRLRGRVLVFGKTCGSSKAMVLVRAKATEDGPWRIVGAATADSSGNFTMPYPFGAFVEAQAVCSLSEDQPADIPIIATTGTVTISTDFLWLAVRIEASAETPCSGGGTDGDCGCGSSDSPSRLPDYSDIIGNEDYTQDLGGGCINLSKPNRTINEFRYQAIVRTSDPDVATYALERHEVGLATSDPRLAEQVKAGMEAFRIEVARVRSEFPEDMNAPSAHTYAWLQRSYQRVVDAQREIGAASGLVLDGLAAARSQVDTIVGLLDAAQAQRVADEMGRADILTKLRAYAVDVKTLLDTAVDSAGTSVRYELRGATQVLDRPSVSLANPIDWQGTPETDPEPVAGSPLSTIHRSALQKMMKTGYAGLALIPAQAASAAPEPASAQFAQAVSVATGHILHYKVVFKADGYSLGDLVYSLPLAPGQKKEIVVFDAAQALSGSERQSVSQTERLSAGLIDDREIASQLGGGISESLNGSSRANTSGVSAGGGLAGGGSMGAFSAGGVLGVSGGTANSNSSAGQNSSRDVAQFFGERLRQSIMQNAEGYRQLNASVVTTVNQGQQYGVTSEVVANHNHCHSMTMMYFEVLRHFAIFQTLSSVEECVFVPLTLARFTVDNITAWRDVLAPALLPMPSSTYLKAKILQPGTAPVHPLLPAFDAVKRLSTHYANVDFPEGSYDEERIRFMKGSLRLRVNLPRPRTRYDRILSLPVVMKEVQTDEVDLAATGKQMVVDSVVAGLTAGLSTIFGGAPGTNIKYKSAMVEAKAQIFDSFMTMDANYQHVPPAQCIRIKSFTPQRMSFAFPGMTSIFPIDAPAADFFGEGLEDRAQWELYARLLGYVDNQDGKAVTKLLDYYFKDRLIAEWDTIFNTDIAPLIFDKLVDGLRLDDFSIDPSAAGRYTGGERLMSIALTGRTSRTRAELSEVIRLRVSNSTVTALRPYVTATVEDLRLTYATEHYNGTLFAGSVGNDLLDGVDLFIPIQADEKRNPRREDRYLAATLVEHLNTHLEQYNKVLWAGLDPDRRFMLLDGFDIQTYRDDGTLPPAGEGMRSLASVVKNEVIGIAGNSLVMPVAPGYRVSQSLITATPDEDDEVDQDTAAIGLFEHYQPLTPVDPYRVSVPTRGVYAEAVLGQCNSCEKIESDRAQDWTVFTTDEPTPIQQVPLSVPQAQDWRAAWREFATPMVNIQNAPALPAPATGLQGLSEILGKSDAFRDLTGLAANQSNAMQTYLSNQANVKALAEMATEMAKQSHNTSNSDKIMGAIESAKASGSLTAADASTLVKQHLQEQIDGGASQKAAADQAAKQAPTPLSQAAVKAADSGKEVKATRVDDAGNAETLSIKNGGSSNVLAEVVGVVPLKQASSMACWATVAAMLVGWKKGVSISPENAVLSAGEKYAQILAANTGLPAADKDDFVLRMHMVSEPLASYPLSSYVDLVKKYGPLWITTDASPGQRFSPHARILVKITGKDTSDPNAILTFVDPATGTERSEGFGAFLKAYEEMATDNKSTVMMPQIVHFAEAREGDSAGAEGFQVRLDGPISIKEPIHELISLAALQRSTVAVPSTVTIGSDLDVNEFLRGVLWNDDPATLFFDEDRATNWNFSTGLTWYSKFSGAENASAVDLKNIIGRSHFFDLQFLHGMASKVGEQPEDTRAKIMLWIEVMYRLSVGDGILPSDAIGAVTPSTTFTAPGGAVTTYTMGSFFTPMTDPNGGSTFTQLFGRGTRFPKFDVKRRAIGSVLHLIQDSYARGHVKRALSNPGDLVAAGVIDAFKPGKFGHWTDIENFHDYRSQNHADHDKYDKVATLPDPTRLDTFDPILGGRDAIDGSTRALDHWNAKDPWATAKPTFDTLFTLSGIATSANGSV